MCQEDTEDIKESPASFVRLSFESREEASRNSSSPVITEKAGRAEQDRNPKREGTGGREMSRVGKLVPKNEFARQRAQA